MRFSCALGLHRGLSESLLAETKCLSTQTDATQLAHETVGGFPVDKETKESQLNVGRVYSRDPGIVV